MKFTIEKKRLEGVIRTAVGAVSSKALIPILTGIYINVNQSGITVVGSNGELSIKTFIPINEGDEVQGVEEGSIVVNAKIFNDIIKKLPENTVTIHSDDESHITIKSGKAKFRINGQDANEYPRLPKVSNGDSFNISSQLLKEVIRKTVFAVSEQETRPILTGVNIRTDKGKLKFVATDSYRLSMCTVNADVPSELDTTIPGPTLKELNKILADTDEMLKVTMTSNLILFESANTVLCSKVLDGRFPDTSRLIPNSEETKIITSKKDLLNSLDRASVLSDNAIVKLAVNGGLMAEISSDSPEIGRVTEDVIMSNFEGADVTLSFSARFAKEALKAVEGDEVIISLNGPMRPFLVLPHREEKSELEELQLVLPVRIV